VCCLTDLADGSNLEYDYDALGQLQLARRFWTGGQVVAGQQGAYEFDYMRNRVFTPVRSCLRPPRCTGQFARGLSQSSV